MLMLVFSLSAQMVEKTFFFNNPQFEQYQNYEQITLDCSVGTLSLESVQGAEVGNPNLPWYSVSLLLPQNTEAQEIEFEFSDFVEVEGSHLLYPYQAPRPLSVTKDIPFECQLVAVCDAFDEMICGIGCERIKVYEAIEYLKAFKNLLFDAKIVDTFLSFTAIYPSGTRVVTNEGEIGVVIAQNRDFQDRPVLRILKDKNGKEIEGEVIKDLVKVHNIFIERTMD